MTELSTQEVVLISLNKDEGRSIDNASALTAHSNYWGLQVPAQFFLLHN